MILMVLELHIQMEWVLVRASNTGPNLTFRAESTSEYG